jgi:hypothetical protein
MTFTKRANNWALFSATALITVASQSVMAHTGVRDIVQENTATYNALTVGHGCNGNISLGTHQDVIAVSAVFPNAADPTMAVVTKLDPITGASLGTLADLSADITGVTAGVGFTNLGLGFVQPNLFPNFIPTVDATATAGTFLNRGFATHNGPIPYKSAPLWESIVSSTGLAPFKVGAIKFNPTSCAISLKVRIAIANWCKSGSGTKPLTSEGYTADDRIDVWMGHLTPKFNDELVMPNAYTNHVPSGTYWPTMTIARNLTTNPIDASCNGGYNLAIEPADADIDAHLPIPRGVAPKGAWQWYWPTTTSIK